MKRLAATVGMLLLCALSMGARAEADAAAWRDAALLAAPVEGAQELMHYYGGTRVEIIREVDGEYVQVNVGAPGGSLMGYMKKNLLMIGEAKARLAYVEQRSFEDVRYTLRAYPDAMADPIGAPREGTILAIGEGEDWLHVQVYEGEAVLTGFVSRREAGLEGLPGTERTQTTVATRPLEGELTEAAAIAFAADAILEAGTMANGQSGVPVTRAMLEGCRAVVDIRYDLDAHYENAVSDEQLRYMKVDRKPRIPPLLYTVTFIYQDRTWEDGFPMICALCCLYVDGENVVEFDFGKG